MTAIVDQPKLIGSLTDGRVDLIITGKESVYNGEHLVYYVSNLSLHALVLWLNAKGKHANSTGNTGASPHEQQSDIELECPANPSR